MEPEVLEAMQGAASSYVRIADLQESASKVIAAMTGAEAGVVTSGASAALTLAMAACIAGLDPELMNRLPDTRGLRNQVIVPRLHRNDYDHALRAAGARIIEIGFIHSTFTYELENTINDKTAAIFFLASQCSGSLPLEVVTETAHRHQIPVIVDAAAELPPPNNLKNFISQGADLVAFSGGKHLHGPQSSGFLCGKKDLILSASLQLQDMDVSPKTWVYRDLIEQGRLAGPPHHGIGRGFKVGKEEIVGLLTALQIYPNRDFERELNTWALRIREIVDGLDAVKGVKASYIFPTETGRPVPAAHIWIDRAATGLSAEDVINQLEAGDPIIAAYENMAYRDFIVIFPEALRDGDPGVIVRRISEILGW